MNILYLYICNNTLILLCNYTNIYYYYAVFLFIILFYCLTLLYVIIFVNIIIIVNFMQNIQTFSLEIFSLEHKPDRLMKVV